jgi:hypothetical protein
MVENKLTKLPPIRSSNWARRLKKELGNSSSYQDGIRLAEELRAGNILGVDIYKNDETGEWLWSIVPASAFLSRNDAGFWLDSAPTKKRAIEICKEMGWKILK